MTEKVLVFGHRNPDNDCISSAVAYCYLKNKLSGRKERYHFDEAGFEYIPARLGDMPAESEWVLKKNGFEAPVLISHVYPRVCDVMTEDPISVRLDTTMLEAGRLLRKHNIRSLVVEDEEGKFRGLISTRNIAERYVAATDEVDDDDYTDGDVAKSLEASLTQKVSELMSTDVYCMDKEAVLKDAIVELMASPLREGVALDDEGRAIGIVTRSDIATYGRRRVILVDHNETLQSAPGIETAQIMEIVDHHRIADVTTTEPIKFLGLPIGSTASIISLEFEKHRVSIPPRIAEVLLSAIMTDTLLLKSPTTTHADREQAEYLADIVGVDPLEFGREVFNVRGNDEDLPIDKLVAGDSKEYMLETDVILVCAHETVNLQAVKDREDEIRDYMDLLLQTKKYKFVLLMVTDIINEGSQFYCEGDRKAMNRVFDIQCKGEGGTWMPGIVSRKKQVAPKLLSYIK
ncbi:MAG: putative manganese-dependent inorganic diphosphatase [Phoenicibacter congonensis]|uniref:Manganese-dependent inorganic diphosphatase n=1 Tax=Phoenicibacter congonensis TaxID=1944646 RepID=A0AA43RHI1_9ACTN|nr:putative manganese-dependent inorganic diphosphatase [Phoenicibacter congonensis]